MSKYKNAEEIQETWHKLVDGVIAMLDVLEADRGVQIDDIPFSMDRIHIMLVEAHQSLCCALIKLAEREFASSGMDFSLQIDVLPARLRKGWGDHESLRVTLNEARDMDFTGAWQYLQSKFGKKEVVEELACRQVVSDIRNGFYRAFLRGEGVTIKAGRMILETPITVRKSYDGTNLLSALGQFNLRDLNLALRTFAAWAGDERMAQNIESFAHRLLDRFEVNSRERISISENLEIVVYNSKFQYRFSEEIGRKLQVFMSLYSDASVPMAEAA